MTQLFYTLKIYFDKSICDEQIINKYKSKITEIEELIADYCIEKNNYLNAGFDLFLPNNIDILYGTISKKIDHGIKCAMFINNKPTAFYLFVRSSTGANTSLRLSNSVGIIDSGYRGNLKAIFDNIGNKESNNYFGKKEDRIVQICGPNISYPILPIVVEYENELGFTNRGNNGLGSSGR